MVEEFYRYALWKTSGNTEGGVVDKIQRIQRGRTSRIKDGQVYSRRLQSVEFTNLRIWALLTTCLYEATTFR